MTQRRFWKIYFIISFIVIGCLSWFMGGKVPISSMLKFTGHLLTVASIIFGIVGAWIAIIWNNRDVASVKFLRTIIFLSFFVILCCLVVLFIYPFLKEISILLQNDVIVWLRRSIVLIFGMLLMCLIVALLYAALALDFFSFDDDVEKQLKKDDLDYRIRQTSQMQKNVDNE